MAEALTSSRCYIRAIELIRLHMDSSNSSSHDAEGSDVATATLSPEVEAAIQTDLAPSMAVAMLAKADHPDESGSPAMRCIAAGVSVTDEEGFIRVQFIFENGTVLPVDMPREAGNALAKGLTKELGPQ